MLRVTWVLPGAVLVVAYCAIAIYANNAWPWHDLVHESGDRTLIGSILFFEHAARELPLDVLLGVAVGGSVLFAFPGRGRIRTVPDRIRGGVLIAGLVVVVGTILGGTLAVGGVAMLSDNLLQFHTRPGVPLAWGAHWRFHLLSRAMLMLCPLGLAGIVVWITDGKAGVGDKGGLLIVGAALALFGVLTIVFLPNVDPFRDPVYLGHQVREVFTHMLVAIPAAWGACLILAEVESQVSRNDNAALQWPVVVGICSVLIGLYLLVGGLATSAASQGQTQNVILLVGPHFFEHTSTSLVVPFTAGLVYESTVAAHDP